LRSTSRSLLSAASNAVVKFSMSSGPNAEGCSFFRIARIGTFSPSTARRGDWRGRRIAPAHEGPRNESNNKAHEPTSGRSTHYGSGHLIRVFRDIGHIFSSLYPSLAVFFFLSLVPPQTAFV